jgi:hypothetical protein
LPLDSLTFDVEGEKDEEWDFAGSSDLQDISFNKLRLGEIPVDYRIVGSPSLLGNYRSL